ncbi:GFA family protein [Hoeflea sp. AS60]|uniref:GFA family protein n=1 Tax=Hoeflea sp. AS60 TaxID=3135780 RepID=UPI00317B8A52
MASMLHGSCHCGGVAFSIPADSVGVVACHCTDCRKMHGNYNAMLAAPRHEVSFESETTLHWYDSSDKVKRGFCTTCGSRLFKDNLGSDRLMVSAGVIDGATGKRIIRNLWEQSKGDWYDLPDTTAGPL